jgi:hypothetical protein
MLSSNTLLLNLILLIDVTFSTPTGHYAQNPFRFLPTSTHGPNGQQKKRNHKTQDRQPKLAISDHTDTSHPHMITVEISHYTHDAVSA